MAVRESFQMELRKRKRGGEIWLNTVDKVTVMKVYTVRLRGMFYEKKAE